jgi:prepilin-type N-terminal cleavage/methylation domain-containing protein
MNVQKNGEKGFTIIEVVLVLAIAGLIFLMVFIALPALQRSQRDSARKTEAGTVASAVGTYQGNNRGSNPTTAAQIGDIVNGKGATLDSGATVQLRATAYTANINVTANTSATVSADNVAAPDEVLVYLGYKCGTTNGSLIKGTARQVAVAVIQESGNGQVYCQGS